MIYRILENLAGRLFMSLAGKMPKCEQCKKQMEKSKEYALFLLPVFQDHTYTPSAAYYLKNCMPLDSVEHIPTGQRACRFWTLTCPACRKRLILAEDFLRVRDTEVVELREVYSYAEVESLLQYAQKHIAK